MNLRPPPETEEIAELRDWCQEMWEYIKSPAFQNIKFVPRATMATPQEGSVYYDSDDNKLKVCTDSSVPTWEDTN